MKLHRDGSQMVMMDPRLNFVAGEPFDAGLRGRLPVYRIGDMRRITMIPSTTPSGAIWKVIGAESALYYTDESGKVGKATFGTERRGVQITIDSCSEYVLLRNQYLPDHLLCLVRPGHPCFLRIVDVGESKDVFALSVDSPPLWISSCNDASCVAMLLSAGNGKQLEVWKDGSRVLRKSFRIIDKVEHVLTSVSSVWLLATIYDFDALPVQRVVTFRIADRSYSTKETPAELVQFEATGFIIAGQSLAAYAYYSERVCWVPCTQLGSDDLNKILSCEYDVTLIQQSDRFLFFLASFPSGTESYRLYDRWSGFIKEVFSNGSRPTVYSSPLKVFGRDGLMIHGYCYERGESIGSRANCLFVHGGPWGRENWIPNGLLQSMLAFTRRIYAINYRGSSGYGRAYSIAGNSQWNGAIVEDLVDFAQFITKAHPNEVLYLLGLSAGAFFALSAASREPSLFAFCIAGAPIVRLQTVLPHLPMHVRATIERRVQPCERNGNLSSIDMWPQVGAIKCPIIFIQGQKDYLQNHEENQAFVSALPNRLSQYRMVLGEAHGLDSDRAQNLLLRVASAAIDKLSPSFEEMPK